MPSDSRTVPAAAVGPRLNLVIQSDPVAVRSGLGALLDGLRAGGLAGASCDAAELVLAEVLNNIVEHAYAGAAGLIEIRLAPGPDGVRCTVVDSGRAMPEGLLPEGRVPAAAAGVADLPEGGFGWFLIRSMTQDLHYRREGGRNHLAFLLADPAPDPAPDPVPDPALGNPPAAF